MELENLLITEDYCGSFWKIFIEIIIICEECCHMFETFLK